MGTQLRKGIGVNFAPMDSRGSSAKIRWQKSTVFINSYLGFNRFGNLTEYFHSVVYQAAPFAHNLTRKIESELI
jgi:hypothetical protein